LRALGWSTILKQMTIRNSVSVAVSIAVRTGFSVLSIVLVFACAASGDGDAAVDSGVVTDTGMDSGGGIDADTDGGADAGSDVGSDATMDTAVGSDSGPDSGVDSGTDSGTDAFIDATVDSGPGGWATAVLFVTSTQLTGAGVNGLAGADDACKMAATAGLLANATEYVAVMSDSATDARDRFSVAGDIRMTDGVLVAASSADLWSSGVMTRVNRTETGGTVGWHLAWTGTQPTGIKHGIVAANFCQDWTSDSGGVETGRTDRSDDGWVAIYYPSGPGNACSNPGGIYCIGPS